jgi:hypothetical protein
VHATRAARLAADDEPLLFGPSDPPTPRRIALQSLCVANNDEPASSTSDHHIEAAPILKEANISMSVTPHRAKDDQLLLAPLESID